MIPLIISNVIKTIIITDANADKLSIPKYSYMLLSAGISFIFPSSSKSIRNGIITAKPARSIKVFKIIDKISGKRPFLSLSGISDKIFRIILQVFVTLLKYMQGVLYAHKLSA